MKSRLTPMASFIIAATVAMLVVLLLVAQPVSRGKARRAQCMAKARGISMAMSNYESAFRAFPAAIASCTTEAQHSLGIEAGNTCHGPNWAQQILGQMEEVELAKAVRRCMDTEMQASDGCDSVNRITPSFLICSSAPIATVLHADTATAYENMGKGNYAACLGSGSYVESIDGNDGLESKFLRNGSDEGLVAAKLSRGIVTVRMVAGWEQRSRPSRSSGAGNWLFGHGKGTRPSDVKDGISKTIIISEVLAYDDLEGRLNRFSKDIRGVWASPSMGASTYTHGHPKSTRDRAVRVTLLPNAFGTESDQDHINGCATGIKSDSPLSCVDVPPSGDTAGNTWAAARSHHPGGVVAARADTSVAFFADTIDEVVWYALGTRAAGDRTDSRTE